MKLALVHGFDQTANRPKTPIDHFKKCPACGDKELIQIDPDVVCSSCNWDSTAWHVSAGGMDDLKAAAREFEAGARRSKIKAVPKRDQNFLGPEHERFFAKVNEFRVGGKEAK